MDEQDEGRLEGEALKEAVRKGYTKRLADSLIDLGDRASREEIQKAWFEVTIEVAQSCQSER